MEIELRIAVEFLLSFVVKKFKTENTEGFVESLVKLLTDKFKGHWYPEHPNKGSGFRCISLCDQLDGILVKAAEESGLDPCLLEKSLPKRLDVWIDPREVSYRIGQYGSVTQIYREGDESVNLASEYAVAILTKEQLQHGLNAKEKTMNKQHTNESRKTRSSHKCATSQNGWKDSNRLSPTAKSFVSRRSPPLLPQKHQTQNLPSSVAYPTPKPIVNADFMRKAFWHPVAIHPARIQAHNYMIAQEIARFEAHMKAQRIALHTHYHKSSMQYVRQMPHQYPIGPVKTVNQDSSNIRVQVVA